MKHQYVTQLSSPRTSHRIAALRWLAIIVMAGLLFALSNYSSAAAQAGGLVTKDLTDGTLTAESLANELVGSGGGVTISNVSHTGTDVAVGTFSGGTDIIGFERGIILSSGNIAGVVGPNNSEPASHEHEGPGDSNLDELAGHPTFNATVLQFDFVPDGDNVFFNFVFSSEEYNEFVNTEFNDVFAFYVNETNCALVDGKPVSINTINNGKPVGDQTTASNPEFYRNNDVPADDPSAINTGMNGLTKVLTCSAAVNKDVTNTMKLAIADSADLALDSNVFIEAGSLTTIEPTPTSVPPTTTPSEPTCDCSAPANPGSATTAPGVLDGFAPISIYSLDNGSIEDSILDDNPKGTKTATGTINGNPTPTEDRFGNANGALLFDGVDDYVQTNEDSNKKPLTFSVWFRADDVSDEHSIVDSDVGGKYGHSLIIGYEGGANGTGGNDGTLDVQYHNGFWDTGKQIQAGVWYHAFVTYGDEMILYLGAQGEPLELVAQQPYEDPDTNPMFDGSNFRFGRHNEGDPQWFKGAMDDIRFYDKALSLEEINEVSGCTCPPSEPPALPTEPIPHCSWGDVHIRTPDGLAYNFQQVGDFVLTQSTSGDVMVQARQEWHPTNNRVSVNKAVALNVAGDKLELYLEPERRFYINGELTELPTTQLQLPKGGIISPSGNDFTIVWPDGNTGARVALVGIKSHMDIGIARLDGSLTYEGVCGNLDGNAQNDMQIQDGDQISMPATNEQLKIFGNSWLVGNESLFSQPISAIETEALIAQSASNVQFVSYRALPANQADDSEAPLTLLDLDPAERDAAEQTCQNAGVTEQLALNTCTYDVAVTSDEVFVESAQTFQTAIEALPPAERTSVAAVPSQGLLSDDEEQVAAVEDPETPTEPAEEPATPAEPAEEPETTTDEPAESDAVGFGSGLCNAPLALPMVLGITFLATKRRKKR